MNTQGLRKTERPNPTLELQLDSELPRICLLLLGSTGVGNSTFIGETSGDKVAIGHGLDSCTAECAAYEFIEAGTRFVLIDTPGFNNTTRDDMEILGSIANFLSSKRLPPISGIIYAHRILDKRVTRSSQLNLEIMKGICGDNFYPHVVLLTTMWNKIPNNTVMDDCGRREAEMLESPSHWKDIISKGCKHMRFRGNAESGINVLRYFQTLSAAPRTELQLELEANVGLQDTKAGKTVLRELRKRQKERLAELEEMKAEEEEQVRLDEYMARTSHGGSMPNQHARADPVPDGHEYLRIPMWSTIITRARW